MVTGIQASSSSSWVNIYTTYFLQIAGVKQPFSYSVLVTCTGLIGVLVSFFFVRLIDRRTVMLVGIWLCVCMSVLMAARRELRPTRCLLGLSAGFLRVFS